MSTFSRITKHPITGVYENARWIDDYFDHHIYGVKFSDDKVYPVEQVEARQIHDFWAADVINAFQSLGNGEKEILEFLNRIQAAYNERWKNDPATGDGATDKSVVVRKNRKDRSS